MAVDLTALVYFREIKMAKSCYMVKRSKLKASILYNRLRIGAILALHGLNTSRGNRISHVGLV